MTGALALPEAGPEGEAVPASGRRGMGAMGKILKYEVRNVIRGRAVPLYALFLFLVTEALLRFSGTEVKAMLSLVNVVLILAPLVAIVLGAMYLYDAREFNELLLSHPVDRRQLFGGLYLGLVIPLAVALAAGIVTPFALRGAPDPRHLRTLGLLVGCGVTLTFVFVAVAFLLATRLQDRVRGLAAALMAWLFFSVLYDGLILLAVQAFARYPLERPLMALVLLNPVDLARVVLLLDFDISALMGYTGAVFRSFFGGPGGMVVAASAMAAWVALPLVAGLRAFRNRDF